MTRPARKPAAKKTTAKKSPAKKAAPRKRAPRKKAVAAVAEVEVFDPAFAAHLLFLRGNSWAEVADATGYPSANAAQLAVTAYLSKAAAAMDDDMKAAALALQAERYQAFLKAWWTAGTTGLDPQAGNIVLKTLERIDKLNRIGEDDKTADTTRTLIITGASPDDYTAQIRAAVEARDAK